MINLFKLFNIFKDSVSFKPLFYRAIMFNYCIFAGVTLKKPYAMKKLKENVYVSENGAVLAITKDGDKWAVNRAKNYMGEVLRTLILPNPRMDKNGRVYKLKDGKEVGPMLDFAMYTDKEVYHAVLKKFDTFEAAEAYVNHLGETIEYK
jgi:hypothetical protein